ncbi:MAG TPA: AAA family ATPase, partial [Acidimicrobiales bacterium]|nr:AAA family ATPase [Acidimicrobiales bacterium]
MRIAGIHVDGYGTLANLDLGGLAPTLSVVYGLNEAGKSTLLDFIRAVLFGFPARRSRQNFREPRRGGRHGGALRLLDEDGRPWLLERHSDDHEPVLTGPDGGRGGDAELQALLGGASAGLFRSIFAFGLDELTSLETLDDDDVRDLVFTAGVLGAGRSATRALRELEERRAEIVRQRSPDARANQLRRRLDDIDARLRTTRAASESYASVQAEHRRLCAETETAQRHLEELHRRDSEIERLRTCWPFWNRIHESEARIAALGPRDTSVERLVGNAAEIRLLNEERSAHALRIEALRQEQVELAGIERGSRELGERRAHLEQSRDLEPAGDDLTAPAGFRESPRNTAELRSAERTLQLLRGLITQRDQLLAERRERDAMERLAPRRSPQAGRPGTALALLAAAFAATAVAAGVEFSRDHPTLGAVGVVAGLALLAAAGFLATGSRRHPPAPLPSEAGPDLVAVDPKR